MRPAGQWNGYIGVVFTGHGKPKRFLIHRLVAWAFVPNPNGFDTVDHLDGNKHINHFANLEWVALGENRRRAIAMGLAQKPPRRDRRGSRNNMAKLTDAQVMEIIAAPQRHGVGKELAAKFGVGYACISNIRTGKSWRHLRS